MGCDNSLTLYLFCWKIFCKDSFPHFSMFGSTKITSQWKTIFGQQKILIKIRLIFYRLFSKKLFWKTISLSRVASPINIIFVCSHGKHNFLVSSFSHGKLSHFVFSSLCIFSSHTVSVTNSGLSYSHRSLSLSLSLSLFYVFLFPFVTQFSI